MLAPSCTEPAPSKVNDVTPKSGELRAEVLESADARGVAIGATSITSSNIATAVLLRLSRRFTSFPWDLKTINIDLLTLLAPLGQ